MFESDEENLMKLHDKAAREARGWQILQAELERLRSEMVPPSGHPEYPAALRGFETTMGRLRAEEGTALGTMMRLREQLGRRPPRRQRKAANQ